MIIVVDFGNDILGSGIFWRGNAHEIHNIKNIPARLLAEEVAKDGVTRTSGMWTVYQEASHER